jgi:hypothetical protein
VEQNTSFLQTFTLLGRFLGQFPAAAEAVDEDLSVLNREHFASFKELLDQEHIHNPWFTREWVDQALDGLASMLQGPVLERWLDAYTIPVTKPGHTIGLIPAGNIPLVGFHDMLCVLASGNKVLARASSKDERLMKRMGELIDSIDPELGACIRFTGEKLTGLDAVIATGSDNSARYFEYYFRDIPHIIRKNRNGVAILTGEESDEELLALGRDIFTYFGMGCRNVSKIYVPEAYDLIRLMGILDHFVQLGQHHKYANNVDYHRSVYLMNRVDFLDNGVVLLKEDSAIASPVGVVFFERYSELERLREHLDLREEEIQCRISISNDAGDCVAPGQSQHPMPWDYADGVDTLRFLIELD